MVATRHPEVAEDELREERHVEADEDDDGRELREEFRVEAARDLRPPEVDPAEVAHDGAADHDVVEVGDEEVRVVDVGVEARASRA